MNFSRVKYHLICLKCQIYEIGWIFAKNMKKLSIFTNITHQVGVSILHQIFRKRTNRRSPKDGGKEAYEYHLKSYWDTPASGRNNMNTTKQAGIPHYICNWKKNNPPYISSPTLVMGYDTSCGTDNSQKLPYRDRSSSVGNKEIQDHNDDSLNANNAADEKGICEYKTHILWHAICKPWSRFY